jgi:hypothetical protein
MLSSRVDPTGYTCENFQTDPQISQWVPIVQEITPVVTEVTPLIQSPSPIIRDTVASVTTVCA